MDEEVKTEEKRRDIIWIHRSTSNIENNEHALLKELLIMYEKIIFRHVRIYEHYNV